MLSCVHFSRLERILLDRCGNPYWNTCSCCKHFLDSNQYQFLRTYKDYCPMIKDVTSVLLIEYVTFSGPTFKLRIIE